MELMCRGRETDVSAENLFIDAHRVGVPERRLTNEHFVDEDSQSPPVDGHAVAPCEPGIGIAWDQDAIDNLRVA